ncbi:MAG: ATP-binding cassette domain-containing protein [Firmicutes bacterium]|nr:ATP-binding cassette domain-containing protein [Bacillota bacterium]
MNKKEKFIQAIWSVTEDLWDLEKIDVALSAVLEIVTRTLECVSGNLWFLNEEEDKLVVIAHVGESDTLGIGLKSSEGAVGKSFKEKKEFLENKVKENDILKESIYEETGISAENILCVPMIAGEKCFGVLQIAGKKDGDFDESDVTLVKRCVTITAMTVEEKGFKPAFPLKKKPIISLRDVKKEFKVGDTVLQVLKGINLDIYENEFLVVLGESGCGKSTMLNIIGGMDFLTSGVFEVEGKDYSNPDETQLTKYRRDYVGFIFQSYNLMPNLTAKENVEFIAELTQNSMDSSEAVAMVGLTERANNFPSQMSGGQQQRVSIARAIVKRPKIILADEPTAALDFVTGKEVLEVIEKIVKDGKTTVVMITHNVEIAKMADRVIKLKGGKVASIKYNLNPLSAKELEW